MGSIFKNGPHFGGLETRLSHLRCTRNYYSRAAVMPPPSLVCRFGMRFWFFQLFVYPYTRTPQLPPLPISEKWGPFLNILLASGVFFTEKFTKDWQTKGAHFFKIRFSSEVFFCVRVRKGFAKMGPIVKNPFSSGGFFLLQNKAGTRKKGVHF